MSSEPERQLVKFIVVAFVILIVIGLMQGLIWWVS